MNQGYEDTRFETTINKNFHCPICINVLKDPVQCQRNQHYFCTPCITKHINENSPTCPICMEGLTLETLRKPPRIVTDYLSSLKIYCDYAKRGCRDVVDLGVLKAHVSQCSYSPVVCSNGNCTTVINRQDQEHHETKICKFRIVQCQDCHEEMSHERYKKHGCLLSKEVSEMKSQLLLIKDQMNRMSCTQEELLKEIRSVMDEIKLMNNTEQTEKQSMKCPSHCNVRGDIVVFGGLNMCPGLNSVEKFCWANKTWTSLPPMRRWRASATSVCYQNKLMVAGGKTYYGIADSIEQMLLDQIREERKWLDLEARLPYKSCGHKCVIHNHHLIVVGGKNDKDETSNSMHEVLLQPPYTSKFKCHIPQRVSFHGLEIFDDEILIIGGTTNGNSGSSVDHVIMCNINNNECKQMPPLPFAMCDVVTVRRKDDVIITGGTNKNHEALNSVLMYNYRTGECKTLPSMKYRRSACATIILENRLIVMGGYNNEQGYLNSVECFNFDQYLWEDLPPMLEHRKEHTAVISPVIFD